MPLRSPIGLLLMVLLVGCSAASPAPEEARVDTEEVQVTPYGAWINLEQIDGVRLSGELLAIDDDQVYVLSEARLATVEIANVKKWTMARYEVNNVGGWVFVQSLLALGNGFWAVFSLPLNWIFGGTSAYSHSKRGYGEGNHTSLIGQRKWARFPQGFPPSFAKKTSQRRSKPEMGVRGKPCFPNDTCHVDLVCREGLCQPAPVLGQLHGPCYANGTCEPGLVCLSKRCVVAPDAGLDAGSSQRDGAPP